MIKHFLVYMAGVALAAAGSTTPRTQTNYKKLDNTSFKSQLNEYRENWRVAC